MSAPERRKAPAGNEGLPSNYLTAADDLFKGTAEAHHAMVAVALIAAPPSAGRRQWTFIVACPYCCIPGVVSMHVHRGPTAHGNERRSGCGRGFYRIVVRPGTWAT